MRLFKEGNVISPLALTYLNVEVPTRLISSYSNVLTQREEYNLGCREVDELNDFLKKVRLPFSDRSVNLAFTSFEESYNMNNPAFSLVSYMTGLECLLSDGGAEKSYKLSRNIAILIGKDKSSSEEIHPDVKSLYKKRSRLVHEGSADITGEDLRIARNLVRTSIKYYLRAGLSKPELLHKLNSLWYDKKWQWQTSSSDSV